MKRLYKVSATHPEVPSTTKMIKRIHLAEKDSTNTLCGLLVLGRIDPHSASAHTAPKCSNCQTIKIGKTGRTE